MFWIVVTQQSPNLNTLLPDSCILNGYYSTVAQSEHIIFWFLCSEWVLRNSHPIGTRYFLVPVFWMAVTQHSPNLSTLLLGSCVLNCCYSRVAQSKHIITCFLCSEWLLLNSRPIWTHYFLVPVFWMVVAQQSPNLSTLFSCSCVLNGCYSTVAKSKHIIFCFLCSEWMLLNSFPI